MLAMNLRPRHEQLAPAEPSRKPVAQPRPQAFSWWDWISTCGCLLVSLLVLWHVASTSAQIATLNTQVDQLQQQIRQVSADNASLTAQVDTLSKPSRILQIAVNKLHMKYTAPLEIATGSAGGP
ncbi:MAG: cell division protein FtsL [Alicyclobacillus sp.]|nr:cell division protein FtsL [Alicyclobacillus sp.]